MAFNYAGLIATSERLIANFGQDVTLRQAGAKSGDEWDVTFGTPTDTTIKVVDLNEIEKDRAGISTGKVTRKLLISTSAGVTPNKGDEVLIDGKWHSLGVLRPVAPSGTVVLWKAELGS